MRESKNVLFYMFDDHELEVADILLNLEHLVYVSNLPSKWGTKRRRSNGNAAATATASGGGQHHDGGGVNSTPSTSLQIGACQEDDINNDKVQKKSVEDKVEATSPSTPLSFYPSESDDTQKPSKHSLLKTSKKMTREELLETVKKLTESRDVLEREVKNVKNYYKQLKAFNMELKAKKREMVTASQQMPHRYEIPLLPQNQIITLGSQKREEGEYVTLPLFTSSSTDGQCGLPDLNISAEDAWVMRSSEPFNYGMKMSHEILKAETAENRKKRRMILTLKRKRTEREE